MARTEQSVVAWFVASGAILGAAACEAPPAADEVEMVSSALLGDPLSGLTAAQKARFALAETTFDEVEDLSDGLGPVFNEKSCGNCHNVGGPGGSGTQFEVRAGKSGSTFNDLASEGGSLFDLFSVRMLPDQSQIPNCAIPNDGVGEPVPTDADVRTHRRTTALFGLGLVDATPDGTFKNLATLELLTTHGRAPLVKNISPNTTTVGKFGWKDQNPTLFQFAGDAYLNEMGITNKDFPTEQPPRGDPSLVANCKTTGPGPEDVGNTDVGLFTDFMRFLAPPDRGPTTIASALGDVLFTTTGCDGCHTRTLTSGASDVAALSNKTYHPFSDFLLHDMGSLGDGIGGMGDAGIREMRTAPLWGLRFVAPTDLLHDGSATSLSDAIMRHDGQALLARNLFALLPQSSKNNLLAFLNTL
jgi:CxxC motif-containing protein (DUF1111 family)